MRKFAAILAYNHSVLSRRSQVASRSNLQIAFSRDGTDHSDTRQLSTIKINLQIRTQRLIVAATRHRDRHFTN